MSNTLFSLAFGVGSQNRQGTWLEVFYAQPLVNPSAELIAAVTPILGYEGGELALVSTAVTTNTPWEATILGTNGKIRLHASAWHPTKMTVCVTGQPDDLQEFDAPETGFYYEVEEVGNCLRAGKLESDILPLDESLGIMRTLDRIRAPWGFKYPTEA